MKVVFNVIQTVIYLLVSLLFIAWIDYLINTNVKAADIIELDKVSIDYNKYISPGRDLLLYPETHKEGINVNLNIGILDNIHWDNSIMSETTDSQYRSIGLSSLLGLRISDMFDVYYHHISLHLIDRPHSFLPRYPVYDSVGIEIKLFDRRNKGSIF